MRHLFQGAIVRAMTTGEFVAPLRPPDGIPAQSAGSGPGRYADFFGLNYYSRTTVTRFDDGTPSGVPVNDLGWEVVRGRPGRDGPVGVADLPPARVGHRERHGRCRGRVPVALPVGAPSGAERPSDARRSGRSVLPLVLRRQLEWNDGEGPRFGLVALDYDTQERAVRDSGRFFAEVIAEGGGTPELYASNVAGQEYPVSRAEGHHR
jgi:beta-glucosidase